MNEKKQTFSVTKIRNGNDFVKCFYSMTAEQQNLFYFAVACLDWKYNPFDKILKGVPLEEVPANTFEARFKIQELFEKMDLSDTKNIRDVYYKNFNTLSQVVIKTVNKNKSQWVPLFAQTTWENDLIKIVFNAYFFNMIFQEKYTTTDLKVLGQLSINSKNNYAQRLYFYLAMYRNTQGLKRYHNENKGEWSVKMTVEYFRELVQMKTENQRTDSFRRAVRTLVSKMNKSNFEFTTDVDFGGYGSNEIFFKCNENLNLHKILKTDSSLEKERKNQLNREQEEIAYYKKKYNKEFQEEFKKQMQNQYLFEISEELKKQDCEFKAYKILKEKHEKKGRKENE